MCDRLKVRGTMGEAFPHSAGEHGFSCALANLSDPRATRALTPRVRERVGGEGAHVHRLGCAGLSAGCGEEFEVQLHGPYLFGPQQTADAVGGEVERAAQRGARSATSSSSRTR